MQKNTKKFLIQNKQNPDFNQYWYSDNTIKFLANQASNYQQCCFMSTPSVYYAMHNPNYQHNYYLFDFDQKFAKNNPNFYGYDFKYPQLIPQKFENYFDFILVDPPFITQQVWKQYAQAIKKVIKKDQNGKFKGKLLLSTIDQNQQFLNNLLGVTSKKYKPSIPNLVYQYSLYSNYQNQALNSMNPQIPE